MALKRCGVNKYSESNQAEGSREKHMTVSTAPVQQNRSTHWTLSGAYPPSQRILASRASVGAPQET